MKHIEYFNKSVEELIRQFPSNSTVITIRKYRDERRFKDYYQTLDSLGFKVGVEGIVHQVLDVDTYEVISHLASIRLKEGNPITGQYKEIDLREFDSMDEAHGYVAKELVYRLMRIQNLDELVAR